MTNAGAMARLVPTMLPTITCRPRRARFVDDQQRLGQAAAFVELDVHDVEATDQACDVREALHAFVGGERNRAVESVEIGLAAARQRLLHELHARVDQRRQHGFQRVERVALIRVDAEPDVATRSRTASDALDVRIHVAAQLELECARLRELPSRRARQRDGSSAPSVNVVMRGAT